MITKSACLAVESDATWPGYRPKCVKTPKPYVVETCTPFRQTVRDLVCLFSGKRFDLTVTLSMNALKGTTRMTLYHGTATPIIKLVIRRESTVNFNLKPNLNKVRRRSETKVNTKTKTKCSITVLPFGYQTPHRTLGEKGIRLCRNSIIDVLQHKFSS